MFKISCEKGCQTPELPQEAETSFEEHMTKWITDQDAYKDYIVKFKYA